MTQYFTFQSEAEAEEFCTRGCPIYGKDLNGNEVKDKGVTTRLANWKKHPTEELWLVEYSFIFEGRPTENLKEYNKDELFPKTANPFETK